jgi:hypothetical protein
MIRLQYGRHPHWPQGIPESRQAGGRNGAGSGLEWTDFTTKVNRGGAFRQEVRGSETGKVITCGVAQPQSQPGWLQQSAACPPASPSAPGEAVWSGP